MAEGDEYSAHTLSHIIIDSYQETAAYVYPPRAQVRKPLRDDYVRHAQGLLNQLALALGPVATPQNEMRIPVAGTSAGTVIRVETLSLPENSRSKASKIPKELEFPGRDVVLLKSERQDDRTETALLFIPDDQRDFLTQRISGYGNPNLGNHPRPDVQRFENIETLQAVTAKDLFVGPVDFSVSVPNWWEVWVRAPEARANSLAQLARNANFQVFNERLVFPETIVLFVHAGPLELAAFVEKVPGVITEVRRATNTIQTFLDLHGKATQHEFTAELLERVTGASPDAPSVCVLDTGVAAAHPLLQMGLAGVWAYDDDWGTDDHEHHGGHGTPMVGLVLFGDLEFPMSDTRQIELLHVAESMKILPPSGFPATQPAHYGTVTQGAVGKAESSAPHRPRVFCLAITSEAFGAEGPSSWSGAIDQISAGSMPGDPGDVPAADLPKRLVLVATGNVVEGNLLDVMMDSPLEDPAQSWNALTVGGYTAKETMPLTPPNLQPVVGANQVSPYSRSSVPLPDDLTPIKPEVLFEAGNMVVDDTNLCDWHPAVSLLSTGNDVINSPLVPFWATSAATALAGNFLGKLQAALPGLWPETYRALTVQSAEWPKPIEKLLVGRSTWKTGPTATKGARQKILRKVGFGVPNIDRAILSAKNDVTLIAQQSIQPFALSDDGRSSVYNEMHFYVLPWPKAALEALENAPVTMKVTLSYFPEPNLSGRAVTRPDTYRAFGLRFEMKKRSETQDQFRARVTASQENDTGGADGEPSRWLLGPKSVQAGSLHCDLWRGRALELARHDEIAIYPVGGWWKSHVGQRRMSDTGRYALIISISAQGQDVDLYSEIENLVAIKETTIFIG